MKLFLLFTILTFICFLSIAFKIKKDKNPGCLSVCIALAAVIGLFITFGLWIVKSLAKFILVTFGITLSSISIAVIVILIYIAFIVIIPLLIMIFDDKKKKK